MQITKPEYDEMTKKIADLTAQLATVTKERDEATKLKDSFYSKSSELERDVGRLQEFLSALPDAPPERPEGAESWRGKLPVPERLAIWIAKRMK